MAAALLAIGAVPVSQAAEPLHTPVRSSVAAERFTTPTGHVITLDAHALTGVAPAGWICVSIHHPNSPHSGCGEVEYRFDAIEWWATVAGEIPDEIGRTITVDLRWRARGEMEPTARPPGLCGYWFCMPQASVTRDGEVAGTIELAGSGVTFVVPLGHPGTLTVNG